MSDPLAPETADSSPAEAVGPLPTEAVEAPAGETIESLAAEAVERPPERRSSCLGRLVSSCLLLVVIALVGSALFSVAWQHQLVPAALSPIHDTATHFSDRFLTDIGGKPRLTPVAEIGRLPVCAGTSTTDTNDLRPAVALMRATAAGERLYDVLMQSGACIKVGQLPYNSAYTQAVETTTGTWSESVIVIDRDVVRSDESDVLAALLVHETTHLDRAIEGTSCVYTKSCTYLANGVDLTEELAAHTAEAQWWIAAYGTNGKRFAFRADAGENRLAHAYLAGPTAFTDYVRQLRSDPREGEGIPAAGT